jgi:hypothetical protein
MNDDDAERLGIIDVAEMPLLAVIDDAAVITSARIDATQHLHQRRLAGAVLANQGMDLALPDGEIDVAQRLHADEGFADTAHFEQCRHSTSLETWRLWTRPAAVAMPTLVTRAAAIRIFADLTQAGRGWPCIQHEDALRAGCRAMARVSPPRSVTVRLS